LTVLHARVKPGQALGAPDIDDFAAVAATSG
jgi:hypothetical protein